MTELLILSDAAAYRAAIEHAAIFDLSDRGKIELSGKDAATFLHNLCTNDVVKLAPGEGCEAFLTSAQAKTLAHGWIYRLGRPDGDSLWLDLAPHTAQAVLQHLDRHLISEKVELSDRTNEFSQLHVAGPQARVLLGRALGDELPPLRQLQHVERAVEGGVGCRVYRHDRLGLEGYDLVFPQQAADSAWKLLRGAGSQASGQQVYEILRVEAGTPVYGQDIDETNLPQEVGRTEQAVSFTKGCYIGQETVARIRTYGHVNRQLVGLRLERSDPPVRGTSLYRDNKEVGRITSSVFSPRLGVVIALASVRRGNHESGTRLTVHDGDCRCGAIVTDLPFSAFGAPPS